MPRRMARHMNYEPETGIGPMTSFLPRKRSTTELLRLDILDTRVSLHFEKRNANSESRPMPPVAKAGRLPLKWPM